MSWYVIEGPDGCGKTTLAEGLARRGWMYQHATADDSLPHLAHRMHRLQEVEHVAWDRAHLGELVHGPLDRGTSPSPGWFNLIEAFLHERGAQGVLLTTCHRPGENDPGRQSDLSARFHLAANRSILAWHDGVPDPLPRELDPFCEEDDGWETRADPEGLGGDLGSPLIWVLGEQQNPLAPIGWPFATRCGTELVWPVVDARYVRVSNALRAGAEKGNPTELLTRWVSLRRPPVITLGNVAKVAALTAGIPILAELTHPQYWLRFHNGFADQYRSELAAAIRSATKSLSEC